MEQEPGIRDYLDIIWRRRIIIIAIFVISIAASFAISLTLSPVYQSEAMVRSALINGAPVVSTATARESLLSYKVMDKLIEELNLDTKNYQLKNNIDIHLPADIFIIVARSNDPKEAKAILDALVDEYILEWQELYSQRLAILQDTVQNMKKDMEDLRKSIELEEKLVDKLNTSSSAEEEARLSRLLEVTDTNRNRLIQLEAVYQSLRQQVANSPDFEVISPAFVPEDPMNRFKKSNLLIAGFFGLFIGVGLAFFAEYWKSTEKKG